ncbi:hypothetical protein ACJRO7_000798 [Eucalyptus globulus]|uniref:MGS-like domain-containing protein n=1 Tax=Eucalyptus globulus TaxID=34317 RepID=A0ABD3LNV2_EUCGL
MLGSPAASTSSAATAAASFRSSLLHFSTIHRTRTCPSTSQSVPVGCVRLQSCSSSRAAPPIKAMAAEAEILSAPDKELRPSSPPSSFFFPGRVPFCKCKQALSDKTDLAFLGKGLQELGYAVVSTGGTASALGNAGLSVTKVEQLSCFPEMHHMEALDKHGIGTSDVVVVNLYPFYDKITSVVDLKMELTMLILNHQDVLVVIDSHDYPVLLEFLKSNGDDQQFCRKLSCKAFQCVASYDSAVSERLWRQTTGVLFVLVKIPSRRLHVDKSLAEVNGGGIGTAIQHHGKRPYICVVVKHKNPCGVASGGDILEAYRLARSPTDGETRMFYETVVAPKYSKKGLEVLRGKSKTLRILEAKKNEDGKLSLRQVGGRWLAQDSDNFTPADVRFNAVSETAPQDSELEDVKFAWLCVEHMKYTYAPSFKNPDAITQRKISNSVLYPLYAF